MVEDMSIVSSLSFLSEEDVFVALLPDVSRDIQDDAV